MISVIALSQLLGAPIRDSEGGFVGRVSDLAIVPEEHPVQIAYVVARVGREDRAIPASSISSTTGGFVRLAPGPPEWPLAVRTEGVLLLKRDLLDQQIIDVHGRKVVRVNDVEVDANPENDHVTLTLLAVDVGARGAVRRLAKGLVPRYTLRALLDRIPPRVIPWDFVDLIETDPSRRVKLKIAYEGLSSLHPADIADIVEDLPPAEREAVFETIDEAVAADTLEELDPKVQVAIVESLDSDRAADIVEQMNPDAAADLLGDLREHESGAILQQMEPEERQEVRQLLEFGEHTAAGRMTTEFLAVPSGASLDAAIEALRQFQGGLEAMSNICLTDPRGELVGIVPLARAILEGQSGPLSNLCDDPVVSCLADTPEDQVAELFDKYNLLTLPVVDDHRRLVGIITADDVINFLRKK